MSLSRNRSHFREAGFSAVLVFTESAEPLDRPDSYLISSQGNGDCGFAKGHAKAVLDSGGEATVTRYEVKSDVGGEIAQLGVCLIDPAAKKLAGKIFKNFAEVRPPRRFTVSLWLQTSHSNLLSSMRQVRQRQC